MQILPIDSIVVRDRQRKNIDPSSLVELRTSIQRLGLLHPPTVFPLPDGKYLLVSGERRLRALKSLQEENFVVTCGGVVIPPGSVPVLVTHLESAIELRTAELEENIIRENLSWQDKTMALAAIHAMRQEQNPKQTASDTARELAERGLVNSKDTTRLAITRATRIAAHLHDPSIAKAKSESDAYNMVIRKEEARVNALLLQRKQTSVENSDVEVVCANLEEYLPTLDQGRFDLICTDPPYGVNAETYKKTTTRHLYSDDEKTAKHIIQLILVEGFRCTKPRANIFMFCDVRYWEWLQRISGQIGWTPFYRPVIWQKSDSEGYAPWGTGGFRITTEFIFFATKGTKGLLASPIDYIRVNRVPKTERLHAAQKPVELLKKLIEWSTLPGDSVLDPCCGSGSTLVAAKAAKRKALGVEIDSHFVDITKTRLLESSADAKPE